MNAMERPSWSALAGVALLALALTLPQGVIGQSWEDLGARERYEALQNYWRHKRLPQERRRDVEEHYERWQQMSPEERERMRQRYQRFRQLPPTERRRVEREHRRRKERRNRDD